MQIRVSIEGALVVSEFMALEDILLFLEEHPDIFD